MPKKFIYNKLATAFLALIMKRFHTGSKALGISSLLGGIIKTYV